MNILNLYAGIGGNRKLWGSTHKITAVESNPIIRMRPQGEANYHSKCVIRGRSVGDRDRLVMSRTTIIIAILS